MAQKMEFFAGHQRRNCSSGSFLRHFDAIQLAILERHKHLEKERKK